MYLQPSSFIFLAEIYGNLLPSKKNATILKGAPARKSRMWTRLVSPALGHEKKNATPNFWPQECNLEYIWVYNTMRH